MSDVSNQMSKTKPDFLASDIRHPASDLTPIRCGSCNRLLAYSQRAGHMQIKCPRCGALTTASPAVTVTQSLNAQSVITIKRTTKDDALTIPRS